MLSTTKTPWDADSLYETIPSYLGLFNNNNRATVIKEHCVYETYTRARCFTRECIYPGLRLKALSYIPTNFLSPVFVAEHVLVRNNTFISSSLLPRLSLLSTFCPTPSYLLRMEAKWEKEKALMLCKHCSAIAKTWVCYKYCFNHKSRKDHTGCNDKKFHPITVCVENRDKKWNACTTSPTASILE